MNKYVSHIFWIFVVIAIIFAYVAVVKNNKMPPMIEPVHSVPVASEPTPFYPNNSLKD